MVQTDWINLFKIRIANASPSFFKHEIIKLLLVMKLLYKYRNERSWIRIYTEMTLENGLKPDIYFEHIKNKEVIIYEIQKQFTKGWLTKKTKAYSEINFPFLKAVDFVPIKLDGFPDDIEGISKKLDKVVF